MQEVNKAGVEHTLKQQSEIRILAVVLCKKSLKSRDTSIEKKGLLNRKMKYQRQTKRKRKLDDETKLGQSAGNKRATTFLYIDLMIN